MDPRVITSHLVIDILIIMAKVSHNQTSIEEEDNGMDVDAILTAAGGFGRFQGIMSLVLVYLVLTIGHHFVSSVFIGPDPPWTCTTNTTSTTTRDFCVKNFGRHIASDSDDFKLRCNWNSSEWKYTTEDDYSFVQEYDLVCSKTSVAALATAAE